MSATGSVSVEQGWSEVSGGWRRFAGAEAVRQVAGKLLDEGARFAALVVCTAGDDRLRLTWHFDLKGTLFSLEVPLARGESAPSIVDLCPGADWAERETHDYFAVPFSGRASLPPLVLREGDAPGFLLPSKGGER